MHLQMTVQAVDQPIVGVGQATVGGEPGRATMFHQCRQAGMLTDPETPPQGIGTQPLHRHRQQQFAIELEQRHRIAGEQPAQCGQQAPVALAIVQFAGQVGDQGDQRFEQGISGHIDYQKSL